MIDAFATFTAFESFYPSPPSPHERFSSPAHFDTSSVTLDYLPVLALR